MAPEPGTDESADRPVQATPEPPASFDKGAPRPERPQMSNLTPAPVPRRTEPTTTVIAARSLWILSFLLGLVALAFAYLSRDVQLERTRMLAAALRPDQDAATLDAVAALVFWSSLGVLLLVIIVEALLLNVMMRQRSGARWALLAVLLLHGGAWVLSDSLLAGRDGIDLYLRILLLAQFALAGAAWVVSMLPGAARWFRSQPQLRGGARS